MSATTAPTAARPAAFTGRQMTGLVIGGLLSLVAVVPIQPPEGEPGPPLTIIVLACALGVVGVVATALAVRTRRRVWVRVLAGTLVINTITALPAFFVPDVPVGLVVFAGSLSILSIVSITLMLTGPRADQPQG